MKEFIEKLIGRLEQEKTVIRNKYLLGRGNPAVLDGRMRGIEDSIDIVNQLAEEYGKDTNVRSNGWIPCSERLPQENQRVIVCNRYGGVFVVEFYNKLFQGFRTYTTDDVLAWQPLPAPFKPKGE